MVFEVTRLGDELIYCVYGMRWQNLRMLVSIRSYVFINIFTRHSEGSLSKIIRLSVVVGLLFLDFDYGRKPVGPAEGVVGRDT